jgi:hypothetical protein
MASILKVDTIQDQSGNNIINENADTITIGASGDTVTIPSGATLDASNATVTIPAVNLTTGVTGTLPVANGGTNLTSGFANGITMADQWRLTTATNSGTNAVVATNWERNDSTGYGPIGTGLTESSGVFTFPSTGIYLIIGSARFQVAANDTSGSAEIEITENNSTFSSVTISTAGNADNGSPIVSVSTNMFLFDVTDITTHKFRMVTSSFSVGTFLDGNTSEQRTGFTVLRLGDT